MKNRDARVDDYIARSAEFARPILQKFRKLVHEGCPEVGETIKWGFPHFEYKGILASMAAFKHHASIGFWKGRRLKDPQGLLKGIGNTEMAAAKIADLSKMPSDQALLEYVREAAKLNESGGPTAPKPKAEAKSVRVPGYFMSALRKNKKAIEAFKKFSPSCRREYVEWIVEAKRPQTREKRIATAVEWIAQGKGRNWKYQ
jgi:uncharacterized protein YdeI (YjbR/CyaY-like superfamily)